MHFDCDHSFVQPFSGIPDRLAHVESSPKTGGSAIHKFWSMLPVPCLLWGLFVAYWAHQVIMMASKIQR